MRHINNNIDTFEGVLKYNNNIINLYKDIVQILEEVEKIGKLEENKNIILQNNNLFDISKIIHKYNDFLKLWEYFFNEINKKLKVKKPKIKYLDISLYKNLDEKSVKVILEQIVFNINFLLLKYHELNHIISKLKLDEYNKKI